MAQLAYERGDGPEIVERIEQERTLKREMSRATKRCGSSLALAVGWARFRGGGSGYWKSQNQRQCGDPAEFARALISVAEQNPPARHFIAGDDAIAGGQQKIAIRRHRSKRTRSCRRRSHSTESRRDTSGRTSLHMVRSALESCVRTVSDTA